MHGVRRVLLKQQAESLGLPLEEVFISKETSNEEYESKMRDMLTKFQKVGISSVVFGDIYLEDIRKYREENLAKIGMKESFSYGKETLLNFSVHLSVWVLRLLLPVLMQRFSTRDL